MKSLVMIMGLFFVVSGVASAANLYVPAQYSTIQAAIDAASSGDQVRVAAGTYSDCTHPVTYNTVFMGLHCVVMKDGVALVGSGSASTIIDAQALGRVVWADNCGPTTRLEGFTIRGGNVTDFGAGLYVWDAQIEVRDVVFDGNTAYNGGGGGVFLFLAEGRFRECVFSRNTASFNGGGASILNANSTFEDCRFTGNSAMYGGGVYIENGTGNSRLSRCLIDHNTASAGGLGGGFLVDYGGVAAFDHCTIADNVGGDTAVHGSPSQAAFTYCILAFATDPLSTCAPGYTFECCDVFQYSLEDESCGTDMGNNIHLDPQFHNREAGDYTLLPSSPCLAYNHSGDGCELQTMGAFEGMPTPVRITTWGKIKAMYGN